MQNEIQPKEKEQLICLNIPESQIKRDPHTIEELALGAKNQRASRIAGEFDAGLKFIKKYKRFTVICVGEIIGTKIRIFTIEKGDEK